MQSKFAETFSTKYNLTQSIHHVSDSWVSDHGTRSHTDLKHQSMSRISSWNRLNNSPLPPHPPVRLSSTASVDRRTKQIIFHFSKLSGHLLIWPDHLCIGGSQLATAFVNKQLLKAKECNLLILDTFISLKECPEKLHFNFGTKSFCGLWFSLHLCCDNDTVHQTMTHFLIS